MNEKHCVNLELSKKLKEAGYPQEGEFWWKAWYDKNGKITIYDLYPRQINNDSIVAPLASELMRELPRLITHKDKIYILQVYKYEGSLEKGCAATYWRIDRARNQCFLQKIYDTNLCNALAKMYLYLAENNLLEDKSDG